MAKGTKRNKERAAAQANKARRVAKRIAAPAPKPAAPKPKASRPAPKPKASRPAPKPKASRPAPKPKASSATSKTKSMSKEDRRAFISKISSDRKISKEEGQKAARKGISLQKIENRNIGDYRQASRDYQTSGRPGSYKAPSGKPTYEPLKIKRGAIQAQAPKSKSEPTKDRSAGIARREKLAQQEKKRKRNKKATAITDPVVPESPTPETFEPDTPDFEGMLAERDARYQDELAAAREANEAAMEEYRRQAEEQRRQFELAQRTQIGNEARAGQQASYQLGGEAGMKRGGTFGFRRRKRRLMRGIGSTLAAATGGMLNV